MSWYTDPTLFIYHWDSSYGYWVSRITKKYNVPLTEGDVVLQEKLDFSKHLYLGNNKESDYDALKSSLAENSFELNSQNVKYVNCQGLVVYWNFSQPESGIWSRVDENDSDFYSLPGIITVKLAEQVVERKISELVAEIFSLNDELINEVTNLKEQLNQEKNDRHAQISNLVELNSEVTYLQEQLNQEKNDRQAQVFNLTMKLQKCCCCAGGGSADVEPWLNDSTVPDHWVPLEELDALSLTKNTPVAIMEGPSACQKQYMEGPSNAKFVEDVTTNV